MTSLRSTPSRARVFPVQPCCVAKNSFIRRCFRKNRKVSIARMRTEHPENYSALLIIPLFLWHSHTLGCAPSFARTSLRYHEPEHRAPHAHAKRPHNCRPPAHRRHSRAPLARIFPRSPPAPIPRSRLAWMARPALGRSIARRAHRTSRHLLHSPSLELLHPDRRCRGPGPHQSLAPERRAHRSCAPRLALHPSLADFRSLQSPPAKLGLRRRAARLARGAPRLRLVFCAHPPRRFRNRGPRPSRAAGVARQPCAGSRAAATENFQRRRIHPGDFRRGLLSAAARSLQSSPRSPLLSRRSRRRHAPPPLWIPAGGLGLRLALGILELLGKREMALQL